MSPATHAAQRQESENPAKDLAFQPPAALTVSEEAPGDAVLRIARVEVTRSDQPPEPGAREALERLLARWMVRAYLRQAAEAEADTEAKPAVVAAGLEEVA